MKNGNFLLQSLLLHFILLMYKAGIRPILRRKYPNSRLKRFLTGSLMKIRIEILLQSHRKHQGSSSDSDVLILLNISQCRR